MVVNEKDRRKLTRDTLGVHSTEVNIRDIGRARSEMDNHRGSNEEVIRGTNSEQKNQNDQRLEVKEFEGENIGQKLETQKLTSEVEPRNNTTLILAECQSHERRDVCQLRESKVTSTTHSMEIDRVRPNPKKMKEVLTEVDQNKCGSMITGREARTGIKGGTRKQIERKNKARDRVEGINQQGKIKASGCKRSNPLLGDALKCRLKTVSSKKTKGCANKKNDTMIEVEVASPEWPQLDKSGCSHGIVEDWEVHLQFHN